MSPLGSDVLSNNSSYNTAITPHAYPELCKHRNKLFILTLGGAVQLMTRPLQTLSSSPKASGNHGMFSLTRDHVVY